MHTLKVTVAGFVLLAGCLLCGRILGTAAPPRARMVSHAAKAFLLIWFIWSGVNLYIGVTKAGYSIAEEVPIFLVVYGVPATVALVLIWRLARVVG